MNGSDATSPSDIFDVLADEYARRILVTADTRPMTAKEISDACDISRATVYRRVSKLEEYGLVDEQRTIGSDGTHRSEFETTFEGLHVGLSDGKLALTLETRDTLADNFTALWDEMRDQS